MEKHANTGYKNDLIFFPAWKLKKKYKISRRLNGIPVTVPKQNFTETSDAYRDVGRELKTETNTMRQRTYRH